MNILVETCLNDLLIVLFDEKETIDFVHEKNIVKKSDELSGLFNELLKRNKISPTDIEKFYVTKGPGSFMGVRAGLIFVSTMAATLNKELFIASSLEFFSKNNTKEIVFDAKGNQSYSYKDKKHELIDFKENTEIDYPSVIKEIKEYISVFKKADAFEDNSFYLKEPRIG